MVWFDCRKTQLPCLAYWIKAHIQCENTFRYDPAIQLYTEMCSSFTQRQGTFCYAFPILYLLRHNSFVLLKEIYILIFYLTEFIICFGQNLLNYRRKMLWLVIDFLFCCFQPNMLELCTCYYEVGWESFLCNQLRNFATVPVSQEPVAFVSLVCFDLFWVICLHRSLMWRSFRWTGISMIRGELTPAPGLEIFSLRGQFFCGFGVFTAHCLCCCVFDIFHVFIFDAILLQFSI